MLTVKYLDSDGIEWIEGGLERVISRFNDAGHRVVVGHYAGSDKQMSYFAPDVIRPGDHNPVVFVMNEAGATVAKYDMAFKVPVQDQTDPEALAA